MLVNFERQHVRSTTHLRPRIALPANSGFRQPTTSATTPAAHCSVRVVCGTGEKKGGKGGGERERGGGIFAPVYLRSLSASIINIKQPVDTTQRHAPIQPYHATQMLSAHAWLTVCCMPAPYNSWALLEKED